jgi:tRNA A22 N-methylase
MVKLSDRLEKICALIGPGERVADIGTDHALLPIALYERGVTRALILSDVKPGPLEKARVNIGRRLPGVVFDSRLGGGLAPYAHGEVDVAVMAGMGGRLIADILSADPAKARSFGRFVLQPRNAADKLRVRLAALGFVITDEILATEGRFICEILCALPGARQIDGDTRAASRGFARAEEILAAGGLSAEISPLLVRKADPLLPVWLARKIETADAVSARLAAAGAEKAEGARLAPALEKSRARAEALRALLDALR